MRLGIRVWIALAVAWAVSAHATTGFAGPVHPVQLSRDEIARLGLQTHLAQAARYVPKVRGFGVVIGLSSIAQADADYRTAQASATYSKSQLDRAQRL